MKLTWLQAVFPDQADQRVAYILFNVLLALLAAYLVVVVSGVYWSDRLVIGLAAATGLTLLAPLVLLRSGHLRAAGLGAVLIVMVTATAMATVGQGIHDIALMVYPTLVVVASLLLGRRGFRVASGAAVAALAWLVFGEAAGLFHARPIEPPSWPDFLVAAVILGVAIMAVDLLAGEIRRNLRQAEEERGRLRALIEASQDGLVLSDADRWVRLINRRGLEMAGLPGEPEAWVGRPLAELLAALGERQPVPPGIRTELERNVRGDAAPGEGEWSLPGRTWRWFNLPVRTGVHLLGRLVVLRDVTRERQLEQMRDDLTRTMVHDLRNPLTALRGALALFALDDMQALSDDQREMLTTMDEQTRRMLTLVSSILDVSQLESGSMPLERTTVRLPALIEDALRLQTPLAAQQQVRLLPTLAADLPPVLADAGLLARVLQNLLGNALKFTPAGGTVQVTAEAEAGGVRVTVRDDGPGIAADVRPRLFQKFAAGRVKGRGSGLGLVFCRLVVEAHGGRIWVESAPGQGTAFCFTLPAAMGHPAAGSGWRPE